MVWSLGYLYRLQRDANRILPFLGRWKGHSITKRSGVYGSTIAEADTVALLEMDDMGQLIQVVFLNCLIEKEVENERDWNWIVLEDICIIM